MAAKVLIREYLKYFFLILLSLILFFVTLEYLQSMRSLPEAANLQALYLIYKSFYAIDVLMPITVVFAMIALKLHLIRSNELVAFYSLGYSRKQIIRPLFLTAVGLTLLYLALHLTSFTYADEYAKNIKRYQGLTSSTQDLFFKYDNSYAYFKRLYPLQRLARDVRIFDVKGTTLERVVFAQEAKFEDGVWKIEDALVIYNLGDRIREERRDLSVLAGFRPKILDSVYEGKSNISLLDALYALTLLQKQHVSTAKLRAVIYSQLFFPFFAPLVMIIIFYFVPVSARLANLNLFVFGAILFSLILWGVLFMLTKLAFNQTILPEIAILLPMALLAVTAFWLYKKF
ncbi:MAG: LptF/LptG family permease [Epsilonproteobacteria bacterium]|nr:permease [Campylobacterota bacterium]NPA57491.1 LptF/LptG family permease [Campylobacterota bacterium]